MIPKEVPIRAELAKRLRQLEEKSKAIGQLIQMMTQSGEQHISNYNSQAREVWMEIEKETGVDLRNVVWSPHPTENKIVPIQMNINASSLPTESSKVN